MPIISRNTSPALQERINTPLDIQTPPTTALSIKGQRYTVAPSSSSSSNLQEQFALARLTSQSSAAGTHSPDIDDHDGDKEPEAPNTNVSLLKKIMVASATLAWGMQGLAKEGLWPTAVSQVGASQKPPTAEDVSR